MAVATSGTAEKYRKSAAALHAARVIRRNYELHSISELPATEHDLAVLIDVSLNIFRLIPPIERVLEICKFFTSDDNVPLDEKQLQELKGALGQLDIALNWLPIFRDGTRLQKEE